MLYTQFQEVKHISQSFATLDNVSWDINSFTGKERPRHVFIAFQLDNKKLEQDVNNAIFDICGVKTIGLHVNGNTIPNQAYEIDFTKKKVTRPYGHLLKYKGAIDKYHTGMLISKTDFMTRYPIYHFDLERIPPFSSGTGTIWLEASIDAPSSYTVHAVLLADKDMSFRGMGTKMQLKI